MAISSSEKFKIRESVWIKNKVNKMESMEPGYVKGFQKFDFCIFGYL